METVDRVVAILLDVGSHHNGSKLSEVAKRLAIPQSSLHRSLTALKSSGFIHQDPKSRKYFLGPTLRRLAANSITHAWSEEILAALQQLSFESGESVALAEPSSGYFVYSHVFHSKNQLRPSVKVGHIPNFGTSAVGRLIARERSQNAPDFSHGDLGDLEVVQTIEKEPTLGDHDIPVWSIAFPLRESGGLIEAIVVLLAPEFRVAEAAVQNSLKRKLTDTVFAIEKLRGPLG